MTKLAGILSLVIFAICVVVHFSTFIASIPVSISQTWPLHLATMAVAAPMILSLISLGKQQPQKPNKGPFGKWRTTNRQYKELQSRLYSQVPRSLRFACVVVFVYAVINFGLLIKNTQDGSPMIENGKYYLSNHGRNTREITEDEYNRHRAYLVRGFSGHWMVFSLMPAIYFLVARPRLVAENRLEKAASDGNAH